MPDNSAAGLQYEFITRGHIIVLLVVHFVVRKKKNTPPLVRFEFRSIQHLRCKDVQNLKRK